jgi:hypothetical protein
VVATLGKIEARLLATMPKESPVDLRGHARAIAFVVIEARKQQIAKTRQRITKTRTQSEEMMGLIWALKSRMKIE